VPFEGRVRCDYLPAVVAVFVLIPQRLLPGRDTNCLRIGDRDNKKLELAALSLCVRDGASAQ